MSDDERGTVKADGTPSDRRPHEYVPNWVIVLIIGILICGVLVVSVVVGIALKNSYDIKQQAKGRAASTQVFCGIADAIVEQVQLTFVSSALVRGDTLEGVPQVNVQNTLLHRPVNEVSELYKPGKVSRDLSFNSQDDFKQRLLASRIAAQQFGQKVALSVADAANVPRPRTESPSALAKSAAEGNITTGINCNTILAVARTKPTK